MEIALIMTAGTIEFPLDECFRCGYDLRGIANDRPCPECGLAAERSRRVTDELHETRPKWLRNITAGVSLVLLSVLAVAAWPVCAETVISALARWLDDWRWIEVIVILGFGVAAVVLFTGVLLLARPEGYSAADRADRWLRRWLRLAGLVPLGAFALTFASLRWFRGHTWSILAGPVAGAAAAAPLPLLLFLRLRSLAKRARSAHLAEHCLIVGIGATVALLCIPVEVMFFMNGEELAATLGFGVNYWETNSTTSLIIVVFFNSAASLFLLWSIYLLLRFVIAFARAARQASQKWKRDDHSLPIHSG